jgi:quercetin dioxygenase-like cupin family protein
VGPLFTRKPDNQEDDFDPDPKAAGDRRGERRYVSGTEGFLRFPSPSSPLNPKPDSLLRRSIASIGEDDERMNDAYVYVRDLCQQAKVPENGILSQTLQDDDRTKVILFGFAPGQELSAHTAPFPAILTFLKGDALLRLGSDEQQATAGTFVHMRPSLVHGIKAQNEVVMLLTMIKNTPATPA